MSVTRGGAVPQCLPKIRRASPAKMSEGFLHLQGFWAQRLISVCYYKIWGHLKDLFLKFFVHHIKARKGNESHFLLFVGYVFSDWITRKVVLISHISLHPSLLWQLLLQTASLPFCLIYLAFMALGVVHSQFFCLLNLLGLYYYTHVWIHAEVTAQ